MKLPSGQRQRLSIARTILKDPAIVVSDEATSAVDAETELLIQRLLDRLAADRTTFVIAHRLSTIKDADRIVVLDRGQVAERGTYEELLANDGLYASLWSVQTDEIEALPEGFLERTAARGADRYRFFARPKNRQRYVVLGDPKSYAERRHRTGRRDARKTASTPRSSASGRETCMRSATPNSPRTNGCSTVRKSRR